MRIRQSLVGLSISFVSGAAFAQAVTYDFTGATVGGTGAEAVIPNGSVVTGTVTFDYAAGDPTESSGSPGNTGAFYINYAANRDLGALVFSMTASVDGFSYATVPGMAGDATYLNTVYGGATTPPGSYLVAEEIVEATSGAYTSSFFQVYSAATGTLNSAGYPLAFSSYDAGAVDEGAFNTGVSGVTQNYISWNLTSLTPVSVVAAVPEPSTYGAMLVGLGMLGLVAFRRRKTRDSSASQSGQLAPSWAN